MDMKTYRSKEQGIADDLRALFERHGLKMGRMNASLDTFANSVRFTITTHDAEVTDDSGKVTTPEAALFTRLALAYGMKAEWLWRSFRFNGEEYVVEGLRDTKGKNKVLITRKRDGSRRVATVDFVVSNFRLAEVGEKEAALRGKAS